jgi:hypothetical protein
MANPTGKFGLKPVRRRDGALWAGTLKPCLLPASNNTAAFVGDPVVLAGSANTSVVSAIGGQFVVGALPTITQATAGEGASNKISGVICGFMADHRDSPIYRVASTDRVALVCTDVFDTVFQVRGSGATTGTFGAAAVGSQASLTSAAGNTASGLSGWTLDESTTAASSTSAQVTILAFANIFDNDATIPSAVFEVAINLPQPFPGIAGV